MMDKSYTEIFKPENEVTLNLIDRKYCVLINTPWVENIALPSSILSNFPVYLNKFEAMHTDQDLSSFIWLKSKDKTNWTQVGEGFFYTPTNEDIGHYLKLQCTPKNQTKEGPMVETESTCIVEAGPGICQFEIRHAFTTNKLTGKEFRVVSYNILADLYCDSDYTRETLFPYCPPYALSIDYRKQLFRKEITGYNADIICLQEVDRKVYKNDLHPIMTQLGYAGDFCVKGGEVVEGLTLFYNTARFNHLQSHRIVFAEILDKDPVLAEIWSKVAVNSKLSARILERTTTLQLNVIESIDNDEVLVVANTHLYFHPDSDHIRLIHGGVAIKYIENFVEDLKKKTNKRISLIFCGDFNSTPECGIYKLYTTGHVPKNFIDYQSNKDEAIDNLELQQPFKLASACGTPKYTNFTACFADCLDYIFYDRDNLSVVQVVPLPSVEELQQNTALPSVTFPSDHVALIADLKFN
ncbi:2',5'-phosphodiesterase 12-like isoform X2 [Aethina tumida]|uniref:2',5'-phosphodiesterase 12-like isoform X2 n=1 Tax=Aethina tumida TaxID=116153 RepID=UPI0021474D1A|nr:2',5'-phosphodiesterase 12-like isoform X2 [Aethina tumida]